MNVAISAVLPIKMIFQWWIWHQSPVNFDVLIKTQHLRTVWRCSSLEIKIYIMDLHMIHNKPRLNTNDLMCLHVNRAEDGPTCIIIKPLDKNSRRSHITWLLNMDVKVNSWVLFFFSILCMITGKAAADSSMCNTHLLHQMCSQMGVCRVFFYYCTLFLVSTTFARLLSGEQWISCVGPFLLREKNN